MEEFNWKGATGKIYTYSVFDISVDFNPDQNGNYIFAKKNIDSWDAIYIGEGDIATRVKDPAHRTCAIKKGATHIHAHINNNETKRKEEETDLLKYNTEAYAPIGCNKKIGG